MRAYGRPPENVELVMSAVLILKQSEPTWVEAKRQLSDSNFIEQVYCIFSTILSHAIYLQKITECKILYAVVKKCSEFDFRSDLCFQHTFLL